MRKRILCRFHCQVFHIDLIGLLILTNLLVADPIGRVSGAYGVGAEVDHRERDVAFALLGLGVVELEFHLLLVVFDVDGGRDVHLDTQKRSDEPHSCEWDFAIFAANELLNCKGFHRHTRVVVE